MIFFPLLFFLLSAVQSSTLFYNTEGASALLTTHNRGEMLELNFQMSYARTFSAKTNFSFETGVDLSVCFQHPLIARKVLRRF